MKLIKLRQKEILAKLPEGGRIAIFLHVLQIEHTARIYQPEFGRALAKRHVRFHKRALLQCRQHSRQPSTRGEPALLRNLLTRITRPFPSQQCHNLLQFARMRELRREQPVELIPQERARQPAVHTNGASSGTLSTVSSANCAWASVVRSQATQPYVIWPQRYNYYPIWPNSDTFFVFTYF